jgi:diguanylate cyclase (GGDEF)-like protein
MAFHRLIPVLLAIAASGASHAPAATAPVLTTLHAVHSLSHDEANRKLPVAFEATVLYFRGYESTLFVQDEDEALYVQASTRAKLEPGDRILVRGTTFADFRPGVVSHDITFLHHGSLPDPVPATFAQMISAELDCRYVAVRGVVRAANLTLSSNHSVTQLELAIEGAEIGVTIDSSDPAALKSLLGAEVEVAGVAAGRFDGKMQQVGILLHAGSIHDLRVLHPAGHNPWAAPATPMDRVLDNYKVDEETPQVRVEGALTYYQPGMMAVLQDGSRSIQVLTPQIDPLTVGDRVEALGIPYADNGFLTIRLGTIRSTGKAAAITPALVSWEDLTSGKHAFDLVTIEGTVVSQVREESQDIYLVSNQGRLFSAVVRHPFNRNWPELYSLPTLRSIAQGSTVRVTGVALLEDSNPFNGAMSFSILLRSADELVVVGKPSWMSVPHLMILLKLLLTAILAVGAWGWSAERGMRKQTTGLAYVEQRRSRILEAMHASRPLKEILEQITELVSFRLDGSPSWCEIADGTIIGNRPKEDSPLLGAVECPITSPTGHTLGTLHAAICTQTPRGTATRQALASAAGLATLAIETSRLHSDLVHRSEFDLLTDVQNRFSLEKSLNAQVGAAERAGTNLGMIYIDLNHFKQVNDNYGHHAGDIYLQVAAARMKRQLRPGDTLARLGGDEFAVLLPDVRHRTAVEDVARRLAGCWDEPFSLEGVKIRGSASLGIAVYPEDAATGDGLLNAADVAMYAAKHGQREAGQAASGAQTAAQKPARRISAEPATA